MSSPQKKGSTEGVSNFSPFKNEERVEDMHLRLSEKYQVFKDLSDRCLINTSHIDKGDKRVFYLKPQDNIFLEEPRKQNMFRNGFIKTISTPPAPEPFTLYSDDLYRDLLEQIEDKSCPSITKQELVNYFKRKQYNLQHRKYKLLLRWAHFALTSELVDKVSLKFSPTYSKMQFELENAVKRQQRLDGDDHFLNSSRPQAKSNTESSMNIKEDDIQAQLSTIRIDDIDVYLRSVTYEQRITREAEKFIQRVKWVPLSHRFEILHESLDYVQQLKSANLENQRKYVEQIDEKGQYIIKFRKMPKEVNTELKKILENTHTRKIDKLLKDNLKEQILSTARNDYHLPLFMVWNEVDLKLQLQAMSMTFGIHGDMDIDGGHSFAYNIFVFFPTYFKTQVIKSQFAIYDAVPGLIDPNQILKQKLSEQLTRSSFKHSNMDATTTSSLFEGKKKRGEFINSVESALFGEFNSGQIREFPNVRIKQSTWIPFICFTAQISKDLVFQTAALAPESNTVDECSRYIVELMNVQDFQNVNMILEGLSTIHFDKVKHGQIRADFLVKNVFITAEDKERIKINNEKQIFTEDEVSFLSIFNNALKPSDFQMAQNPVFIPPKVSQYAQQQAQVDTKEIHTLLELPQHLLYSLYMLKYLKGRDQKIKLLYTMNAFRAVQKRVTLELREMGTRDRVMGDSMFLGPMENPMEGKLGSNLNQSMGANNDVEMDTSRISQQSSLFGGDDFGHKESSYAPFYKVKEGLNSKNSKKDQVDVINDELIDIHKIRFNEKLQNFIFSTNPILPRFHSTFGEPISRQEISAEMISNKNSDNKKDEGKKLLGRMDQIYFNETLSIYMVKDDFGKHILFDCALLDMQLMEQEVLRIVSYYINKQEPVLAECDLRNIFPACDRFELIDQAFECELHYQNAKVELAICYLECLEHITDLLQQQRMIQIIVDLMAGRPRLNLSSTHFKDSYTAEVELLKLQHEIMREVIRMQMTNEFEANNSIREYLERTYRLVMDQGDAKWQYQKPETLDQELRNRENLQKGLVEDGPQHVVTQEDSKKQGETEQTKVTSSKFSDPKEFAAHLGIPFASLQMLMKDHKERDPLVQQTIHEHVSFIKIEEGYPNFMYNMASKQNNTMLYTRHSERIGMLDFYESLTVLVKVVAAMKGACTDLAEVHKPDNGLTLSALEICTYRYIHAELKLIKGEKDLTVEQPSGTAYLEDDSIVGNPDRMLFYAKEFMASGEDDQAAHNPYVLTKLNLKTIDNFSFDAFQKLLLENKAIGESIGAQNDDLNKRRNINQHHAYRFFPKLKARAQKIFIPSMLHLTCNSVELLRLKHLLQHAVLQKSILEKIYMKQVKTMRKEGVIYFKDPFNFQTFIDLGDKSYINFVDEGPGTGIDMPLAINEFDPSLRSHINFSDPDSFKMLICPMGLEELRVTLFYELVNLQTLIVATKTNQALLDNPLRQVAEIDLFMKGQVLPNPVFNYYSRIVGSNLSEYSLKKQAQSDRSTVLAHLSRQIGDIFYNVISRKNRSKVHVQNLFQKNRPEIVEAKDKSEVQLRKLRTYRLILCTDFCFDILTEVYADGIRLQMLQQADQLRRRAYLLPKDQIFMDLGKSEHGEYRSYYNSLADNPDLLDSEKQGDSSSTKRSSMFFEDSMRLVNIQKFWRVPSNLEIVKLFDSHFERLRESDFKQCYLFENKQGAKMVPDMRKNSQHKLIQGRIPQLQALEMGEGGTENFLSQKKRFVEYKNALCLERLPLTTLLKYLSCLQNLFDLEFFQTKMTSSAKTMAEVECKVLAGLSFWEMSEEEITEANKADLVAANTADGSFVSHLGYKNTLASKVVERIGLERKNKFTLNQELEGVKDKFTQLEKTMIRLELNTNLDRATQFINDYASIAYYTIVCCLGQLADRYVKEGTGQKEILEISRTLSLLSHQEDVKVTYTNGFHVNTAVTRTEQVFLDETASWRDLPSFLLCAQPVIDEKALIPNQLTMIEGMYTQNRANLHTFKKTRTYMGALHNRDYHYLDVQLVNLEQSVRKQAMQYFSSVDQQLKEYIRVRFQATEEVMKMSGNPDFYFEMLVEQKAYLRTFIRARQLKKIVMIILNHSLIPLGDRQELQKMLQRFNENVQWKINSQWDDQQHEKIKQQSKLVNEQKEKAAKAESSYSAQSITQALRQQKEKAMSNAMQQYEYAQCEIEVLQNEVHRFLISTSFRLFDQESAALARAYEVNGKQFEFYIHPCQQFASTVDQKVDKRHHLDPVNKVAFAQKFLTQIRNRCLEIETLTSGIGVVISQKDMNECLQETCRSIIKHNEIEMRTRSETHAMQLVHFENLLYIKDQQLLNLEMKLSHGKGELDKIIRTKVFSRGKQIVYELDFSNRQLRLIKDSIFNLEKRLSEQVGIAFQKELVQTKSDLKECRTKFLDFQNSIETVVNADIRENVTNIDQIMKGKAEHYKNLAARTAMDAAESRLQQNQTTYNIQNITIKNVHKSSMPRAIGTANTKGGNPYYYFMNGTHEPTPEELLIGELRKQITNLEKQMIEFESLKQSERTAHEQILQLQNQVRDNRLEYSLKEVQLRQRYETELENLRAQLNSNTQLWGQLSEAEKREKILKGELERAQNQIITQEKIIEQMKDTMKKERIEKAKLVQYKQTKSKRLEDLESKAREFEVMSNINLPKMVGMLENKESQIQALISKERLNQAHLTQQMKLHENDNLSFRKRLYQESSIKTEAINKFEGMRHELQLIEGGTEVGLADVWKEKCKKLIEICKSFRDENDRLQRQQHPDDARESQQTDIGIDIQKIESEQANTRFKFGGSRGISHNPNIGNQTMSNQQQLIQPLFQSFAEVAANQNINQSTVLGGSFNGSLAMSGGGNINNNNFNSGTSSQKNHGTTANLSSQSADRSSKNIQLQKLSRRATALATGVLIAQDGQQRQNIFKQTTTEHHHMMQGQHSPKTPIKTLNDHDSHLSSINQNLDPMYAPTKQGGNSIINDNSSIAQMSNKFRNAKMANYTSDNVFSSLKPAVGSINQFMPPNLSQYTSDGILADYASGLMNTTNVQVLNPQMISVSRNIPGVSQAQTSAQNQQKPPNSSNIFMTSNNVAAKNIKESNQRTFSNSFVRSKIMSPPRKQ